jgi:hypothetical protein
VSAEALPQQAKTQWPGFKYEPVRGLMNRHISRYLRIQRKNMRRFFSERGFSHLAARLDEIRKDSAMGMLEKNRKFQEILNAYAKAVAPPGAATVHTPGAEANDQQNAGSVAVEVPSQTARASDQMAAAGGTRGDAGAGVQVVVEEDGGAG